MTSPSKIRYRERKRRERNDKLAALRAAGANCGNCTQFKKYPCLGERGKYICDLHSDFHGYQITTSDNVCTDHERRKP